MNPRIPPIKVWLLTVGEPWPTDPGAPRLLRAGILAEMLSARGHEVTWWSSNFDHTRREHRFRGSETHTVDGVDIVGLDGPGYREAVSVQRILNHRAVASEFRKLAPLAPRPDVIVASMPTIELAAAGADYAKARGIPFVTDIRDFWPDLWLEAVPPSLSMLGRVALWPAEQQLRRTLRSSTAICACSDGAVDWALEKIQRQRQPSDRTFHHVFQQPAANPERMIAEGEAWEREGVRRSAGRVTISYVGALAPRNRLDFVIDALRTAPAELQEKVTLVIAGKGEAEADLRQRADGLRSVLFPGWIDTIQIMTLLERSDLGLLPYPSTPDRVRIVPNKFGEYISAGLPVLNCSLGAVDKLIKDSGCGLTYSETDPSDIVAQLAALLAAPDRLTSMRLATAALAPRFDEGLVYGEYCDFMEELAHRFRAGQPTSNAA